MYIDNLELTKMTDYDYQYEREQAEKERQKLFLAEISAYSILRDGIENNKTVDVIWDDPNNPNVRYYGEVLTSFLHPYTNKFYTGEAVLNIVQDFGDGTCAETELSKAKLEEWSRDIAGDICDAEDYKKEMSFDFGGMFQSWADGLKALSI